MKKYFISAMLSALLFLTGCNAESSPEPVQGTFFAMDTMMDFTIYGESGLIDQSESLIASLESLVSVTDANSELYAINQTRYADRESFFADGAGAGNLPPHGWCAGLIHLSYRPGVGLHHRQLSGTGRGGDSSLASSCGLSEDSVRCSRR